VRTLYETLHRLHLETRTLSVADAINRIFETIPIRILAARSFSGEQAVANLEKIRQQAAVMGRGRLATLQDVVAQLERCVLEVEEEGENALAEESVDAVKILSIHKAKGLEFPVVVLPDARGAVNRRRSETGVQYDWSSNLIGLRTLDHVNLAAIYLEEKRRMREEEEQKRLFYVAMTRAREHVMISSSPLKVDRGSFVEMLERALGRVSAFNGQRSVAAGEGTLEVRTLTDRREAPRRPYESKMKASVHPDWSGFARRWEERTMLYEAAQKSPLFVSPTALKKRDIELAEFHQTIGSGEGTGALVIGSLAHHFLERLDFSAGREGFDEELARYVEQQPESVLGSNRDEMRQELSKVFSRFFRSKVFAELSSGTVLGREVPLLIPWDGQIMEGVIDVIYERDGLLYIADYKTDRIRREELTQVRHHYRHQAEIYSDAVRQSLKREVAAFKLIFLRLGEAVELRPAARQGELFLT
jgi:ATP-dependent helicase/nuclease subunit A